MLYSLQSVFEFETCRLVLLHGELAGRAVLIFPFVFLWQISLREAKIKLLF